MGDCGRNRDGIPTATEAQEQEWLFHWALLESVKWPELRLMYHIPNEGKRSVRGGAAMKRQGLRAGVPDICLPVPRGGCHGLYIELKREHGGRISAEQTEWMERLTAQGYQASLCHGWRAAAEAIEQYMRGDRDEEQACEAQEDRAERGQKRELHTKA